MNLQKVELKRLTICPCGYSVLDDAIQLGTKYTIDLDTVVPGFYRCGRCGREQTGLLIVHASQQLHPYLPPAPLPYDLFLTVPSQSQEDQ